MTDRLWNIEDPVSTLMADIWIPKWIDPEISPSTIAAICQGGCESGAYMPAVTYHEALETMRLHGDDVLQFLEDALGELPRNTPNGLHLKAVSWSGLACFYLSCAVECWASALEDTLRAAEGDEV
jgi:hypothetical protein